MSAVGLSRSSPPLAIVVVASFVEAICWLVYDLPGVGESLLASECVSELGGKGLNVAVACARLGARVLPIAACGADAAGDAFNALLEHEGIDARHVHRLGTASGRGGGFVDAQGRNMIAVDPGANALLEARHVDGAAQDIASAALLYAQLESPDAAIERAFGIAIEHGVPTVLNASPWRDPGPGIRRTTRTLIVNETESLRIQGPAGLFEDWSGLETLVLTEGAQGSSARVRDRSVPVQRVAAFAVKAIDSVGAGDAFAAAFCVARARGLALSDAMRVGNAAGALIVSRKGVLGALPDAAQVERMLCEGRPAR